MTLPPEKIGDKGQRWEVKRINMFGEHELVGWTDTFPSESPLIEGAMMNPSNIGVIVIDRQRYRSRGCTWPT